MVFTLDRSLEAFEQNFEAEPTRQWLADRWHHSVFFAVAYMAFVFAGRTYMQKKNPLNLKYALIIWNTFLAVFSIVGTLRIMPEFLSAWKQEGFRNSYCRISEEYYEGVNGFWVYLFHISKLLELGDTVFLVLRKRPVIFLHWYHHVSVLLYTWITYPANTAPLRWGIGMNFTVHAFMYVYYTLRAANVRCPKFIPPVITTMQIVQFIVGTYVCFDSLYLSLQGRCDISIPSALSSFVMYVSYLGLFMNFFYHAYITKNKKRLE